MSDTNNKRHITPQEFFATLFTVVMLVLTFIYFLFL